MPKIVGALLDPSDTDTGRMESRPPDQLPTVAISNPLPKDSAAVKSVLIRVAGEWARAKTFPGRASGPRVGSDASPWWRRVHRARRCGVSKIAHVVVGATRNSITSLVRIKLGPAERMAYARR